MITNLLPYLQTLLAIGNLCIMLWGFKMFLSKPRNTLEDQHKELEKRVDIHEVKLKEIEKSLDNSHQKHREQEKTNKSFQSVMLSFVNFEIAYCLHTDYKHTEELLKAKDTLEAYINDK